MANNTAYSKQYFYGWQTQDDRLWGDTGFLYGENINPFNSTGYVELSKKPLLLQETITLINNKIKVKDPASSNKWDLFVWSATFYKGWQTAFWWQNLDPTYPNVADRQIKHIWQMWDYVYWTYNVDSSNPMVIGRFEVTELQNSSMTAPTYWYTGLTGSFNPSGLTGVFKQEIVWNIVYLTMWDKISVLDFWDNSITNYNFWGETIVGINYDNGFRITLESGRTFIWDWVSEWPWEMYELPDSIITTTQIWNETYMIGWQYQWYGLSSPTLYKLSASWFEKLFSQSKSLVTGDSKFRIVMNGNNCITKIRDFIVMIDENNNGKDRIAVYGNTVNGLQRAYVIISTRNSQWNEMTEIWMIKGEWNKLYIWRTDGTNYGIDTLNFDPFEIDQEYHASWFVITNVEDMGDKVIRKAKCQLHTRLSGVTATRNVVISSNTNYAGFNTVATVTDLDESEIDRQSTIWDYRDICFKYVLNSDWEVSPRLYWLKLEYEPQGL